jgi:hypothetical protein
MTQEDLWRKASYSSSGSQCVEVNRTLDALRDSKNGETLRLNPAAVVGLLHEVRRKR